jgi:hypothetical protein
MAFPSFGDAIKIFGMIKPHIKALIADSGGAISGTGTSGKLAKFTGASAIGDATNTDTQVAAAVSASHSNVTLAAANDATLKLSTQELTLMPQPEALLWRYLNMR